MKEKIGIQKYRIGQSIRDAKYFKDECYKIVFCHSGYADIFIGDRRYSLCSGSVILLGQDEVCTFASVRDECMICSLEISWEYCMLHITESALVSLLTKRSIESQSVFRLGQETAEEVCKNVCRLMEEDASVMPMKTFGMALILNNILLDIYREVDGMLLCTVSDTQRAVWEIQEYISRNYNEAHTLDSVSNRFYISKYQISRMFKEVTGCGFKRYINMVRLREAKKLLLETSETITNICYEVGYNDVNNFIRSFQVAEGVTPLHFRKMNRAAG